MNKARSKKTAYHHGNLKSEAIEVASQILASEGSEGITIRKVASSLGVFPNALYRHFKNKDELQASIAERGFEIFEDYVIKHKVVSTASPEVRIQRLAGAYLEFAYREPHYFKLIFTNVIVDPSMFPTLFEKGMNSFNLLLGLIEDMKSQGKIGSKKNTDDYALIIWTSFHGFVSLAIDNRYKFLGITKLTQFRKCLRDIVTNTLEGIKSTGS